MPFSSLAESSHPVEDFLVNPQSNRLPYPGSFGVYLLRNVGESVAPIVVESAVESAVEYGIKHAPKALGTLGLVLTIPGDSHNPAPKHIPPDTPPKDEPKAPDPTPNDPPDTPTPETPDPQQPAPTPPPDEDEDDPPVEGDPQGYILPDHGDSDNPPINCEEPLNWRFCSVARSSSEGNQQSAFSTGYPNPDDIEDPCNSLSPPRMCEVMRTSPDSADFKPTANQIMNKWNHDNMKDMFEIPLIDFQKYDQSDLLPGLE